MWLVYASEGSDGEPSSDVYCAWYTLHVSVEIENKEALGTTELRRDTLQIIEAGLASLDTAKVVHDNLELESDTLTIASKTYRLPDIEHIYVLGVGKCSLDAARAIESVLGDHITEGLVIDVRDDSPPERIKVRAGTHPYPSEKNVRFTAEMLAIAEKATERDLVLFVISGGGSALLCQPESHTPEEEAALIKHLFEKGATIHDLNIVRKHLSHARGGHLAAAAHPATLISLIFSDVPGNDLATIASGPTVRDETSLTEACEVFARFAGEESGFSTEHLFETPKEEEVFARVRNELVLTNETALGVMKQKAEGLGYTAEILDTKLEGEARDTAMRILDELRAREGRSVVLYGGETTVTVQGNGVGGRNCELALAAALAAEEGELVTSIASDGRDNSDLAGGLGDNYTKHIAEQRGLNPADFLNNSDSYTFFHTLEQGISTGYTGSNVADLLIGIKY